MIRFFKSHNFRQYKCLADGLHKDFGDPFKETMRMWCKKVDDGKFWQVWIIKQGKETVGVCGLYSLDYKTNKLWLGWFGILKKYRNKGLGKIIMPMIYAEAKNVGCKQIFSYVDKKGKPLNFYYREGFERCGTVEEFVKKTKVSVENFQDVKDHIIMKKL